MGIMESIKTGNRIPLWLLKDVCVSVLDNIIQKWRLAFSDNYLFNMPIHVPLLGYHTVLGGAYAERAAEYLSVLEYLILL